MIDYNNTYIFPIVIYPVTVQYQQNQYVLEE